jgi:hypothetical protein
MALDTFNLHLRGDGMEISIPHEVTYEFPGKAPVSDVARSLLAQERLIRDALDVFENCFPAIKFESISVTVSEVQQKSPLRELLQAIIIASYQEELSGEVPALIQNLFGLSVSDSYNGVVTVLVLCIAVYGIDWIADRVFATKSKPELAAEKEKLLGTAAEMAGVSADRLDATIQGQLGGARKRSVMKASSDLIMPAKRNKATEIRGLGGAVISQEFIRAAPSDVDLAQYEPDTEDYLVENVLIKFHRHDIDRTKDWAATVDVISRKRKTLHLDPIMDAEKLFDRKSVRGDVLVTSERNADGEYTPVLYRLVRVYD